MGRGGFAKDDREAARYYRLAVDQGNAIAQNNLGILYRTAAAVCPRTSARRCACSGSPPIRATPTGRTISESSTATAAAGWPRTTRGHPAVQALRRQGNADAQVSLGYFSEMGRGGLTKDDHEAAPSTRSPPTRATPVAQNNLGVLLSDRARRSAEGRPRSARFFKLSSDQGNAYGQDNLGVFYRDGRGGLAKDDMEAARLFKLSADQDNADARVSLGYFAETGRGGYTKAIRGGAPVQDRRRPGQPHRAKQSRHFLSRRPRRAAQDESQALRLFRLAADQGNAYGQDNLGVFYRDGRGGLAKDDHEAARLFKLAADQGNADACVQPRLFLPDRSRRCRERSRGRAPLQDRRGPGQRRRTKQSRRVLPRWPRRPLQDDREALRLFRLAADQDNSYGQQNLGVFYRDGRGGLAKDDREAARLFKLAADQGNANALTALRQIGPEPLIEANATPAATQFNSRPDRTRRSPPRCRRCPSAAWRW